MRPAITLITMIFLALGGCGAGKVSSVEPGLSASEKEAIVSENCETLVEALDAFAAENGGFYPEDAWMDTTDAGRALIDFLPGRRPLLNPFTGEETEPVLGTADAPGEIGYIPPVYARISA